MPEPSRRVGHGVLSVAEGLGQRAGALFGAAVLFAPTLVALGMTGPIAVKLKTRSLSHAGLAAARLGLSDLHCR